MTKSLKETPEKYIYGLAVSDLTVWCVELGEHSFRQADRSFVDSFRYRIGVYAHCFCVWLTN